jgi:hypothetical protein
MEKPRKRNENKENANNGWLLNGLVDSEFFSPLYT